MVILSYLNDFHEPKMRKNSCLLLVLFASFHYGNGKKLEKWFNPHIEGSIEKEAITSASRNPKLFFGTTTTSTTTLSTTTACYVSAAALTTACAKKKRSIFDDPIEGVDNLALIQPSSPSRQSRNSRINNKSLSMSKLDELNQLANVKMAGEEEKVEPRFFLFYWYTSTVTTTATTFTRTTTFTITACSPASFAYALCG